MIAISRGQGRHAAGRPALGSAMATRTRGRTPPRRATGRSRRHRLTHRRNTIVTTTPPRRSTAQRPCSPRALNCLLAEFGLRRSHLPRRREDPRQGLPRAGLPTRRSRCTASTAPWACSALLPVFVFCAGATGAGRRPPAAGLHQLVRIHGLGDGVGHRLPVPHLGKPAARRSAFIPVMFEADRSCLRAQRAWA
jgi:hypothetical protein